MEDLRERLKKAELASEEYQKQIGVFQSRLDDAIGEQAKLEERLHEEEERAEGLQNEQRESLRQRRELEGIYEAERAASMKDKESAQTREEELHGIIQRLKEGMAERETRTGVNDERRLSRHCMYLLSYDSRATFCTDLSQQAFRVLFVAAPHRAWSRATSLRQHHYNAATRRTTRS